MSPLISRDERQGRPGQLGSPGSSSRKKGSPQRRNPTDLQGIHLLSSTEPQSVQHGENLPDAGNKSRLSIFKGTIITLSENTN